MQFWLTAGRENILRHVPERWQKGYDLWPRPASRPGKADGLYTNQFVEQALR